MANLARTYRSKTHALPEALNEKTFNVSNSVEGALIEAYDLGFISRLHDVMKKKKIPYEGTYLIIDIGHAHLVGIADYLLRHEVEPYFMIPGKANDRIKEALKYWKNSYEDAKRCSSTPKGFATLFDCHRDTGLGLNGEYNLLSTAFPTPEKLMELGISRVFYANEGDGELEKPYGAYATEDVKNVIKDYEKSGLKFMQHGIFPSDFRRC